MHPLPSPFATSLGFEIPVSANVRSFIWRRFHQIVIVLISGTKYEHPLPKMLIVKFGWNWLSGSWTEEGENEKKCTTPKIFDQKKLSWTFGRLRWIKIHLSSWVCAKTPFWHHHHQTPSTRQEDKVYVLSKFGPPHLEEKSLEVLPFHLKHLIHFRMGIYFMK